jgi:aminopeptidase
MSYRPKAMSVMSKDFQRATSECRIAWTVAAMASPGWAAKVLGKPATQETSEELWRILVPILKLDQSDPVGAWAEHGRTIQKRMGLLNSALLKEVRFQGPGTDLTMALIPGSSWVGASAKTQSGREFWANLPSVPNGGKASLRWI